MKTIVLEQPGSLTLSETEMPAARQEHAVLRIRRIGICGTDYHAFNGNQPFFTYPRILGHELSGEIVSIESAASSFKPGDQVSVIPYLVCGTCIACRSDKTNCCTSLQVLGVHTDGGMREYLSVPAANLIAVNGLDLDQAAIIEPLSIGAHAVRRAGLQPGESVLVIGGGPIGLGVMAFAKQQGAKVIAMDINQERLDFCTRWSKADAAVNALNDPVGKLVELTEGDLPTTVFDATGNLRSMESAFQYAAHGGKLVYVGLVKSDISFHDPDFHKKELTLLASRNATKEDFHTVIEALRSGAVDSNAYITHRCPLDSMIGRYTEWMNPSSGVIKAIVEV